MACKWFNCKVPTAGEYCTLHAKQMGIENKPKERKQIAKVSEKKKSKAGEEKERKQALDKFFEDAIVRAPFHCENCGADLRESFLRDRAIICHILSKKTTIGGFPSVATNENNFFYGCNACHHGYDNIGSKFILKMSLLPELKRRVSLLIHLLTPEELNRVPEYLKL